MVTNRDWTKLTVANLKWRCFVERRLAWLREEDLLFATEVVAGWPGSFCERP